ncbi:MAG: hypothetical protein N2747_06260 [Chitinophagaceae bacterium]|nr:hypothetical protein [Chitinophagaceae bacterium]
MDDEYKNLSEEERLRAENEFIKMKLMLERGARFHQTGNEELPPEVEHKFLSNILEFEKKLDESKIITVFEKAGSPAHFRPAHEIPQEETEQAWISLKNHLANHNINVDAINPHIPAAELYRFVTEELFRFEINDFDMPDFTYNFIYEEFHPNDYSVCAEKLDYDLMNFIFTKHAFNTETGLEDNPGFLFNGKYFDDMEAFAEYLNAFKEKYDDIELEEFEIESGEIHDNSAFFTGRYLATATLGNEEAGEEVQKISWKGTVEAELIKAGEIIWHFKNIRIHGLPLY